MLDATPAVQAKGTPELDRNAVLKRLSLIWTLHSPALVMLLDSKMQVYMRHFKGDTAAYAMANSRAMLIMGSSGLMLNPVITAMLDSCGRKSALLLTVTWSLCLRLLEVVSPTAWVMFTTTSLASVSAAMSPALMTVVADLFPGDPQSASVSLARLQSVKDAAGVLGPLLGGELAKVSTRLPFACSAALNALELCVLPALPETLPAAKRKPVTREVLRRATNPLAFLRLFWSGPRLAALGVAQLCQVLTEPALVGQVCSLVYMETLGWGLAARGRFSSLSALATALGGVLTGPVLQRLGPQGALALSVAAAGASDLLSCTWVTRTWQQVAVLPALLVHATGYGSLSAMTLSAGAEAGMSQAELRGCLSSIMQVSILAAYPFWARVYAFWLKRGRPRHLFLGIAAVKAVKLLASALAARCPPSRPTEALPAETLPS